MTRFLLKLACIWIAICGFTLIVFCTGFKAGFEAGASLVTYIEEKI